MKCSECGFETEDRFPICVPCWLDKPDTPATTQTWSVTLSPAQLIEAERDGRARQALARSNGRTETYGAARSDDARADIDGRIGEVAVAHRFGVPTTTPVVVHGSIDIPDLILPNFGPVQVRSTRYSNGCLIVHPREADGHGFVLVTLNPPHANLRGWLYGAEAKQPKFWRTNVRNAAFFVPIHELRPMELLVA